MWNRLYNNEDQILQDLLETNIRQRGDVGGSAKKVGLRIKELERLYGIKHGNNQNSTSNNYKSQEDMASEYKRLPIENQGLVNLPKVDNTA